MKLIDHPATVATKCGPAPFNAPPPPATTPMIGNPDPATGDRSDRQATGQTAVLSFGEDTQRINCANPALPTGASASHGISAQRPASSSATRRMNGTS